MFLVNLSLGEFLALFGAVSGAMVALYLLDRSRRRQVVATLRFWTAAEHPVESRRRRRIRQWPSLLLQILALVCLLLAVAQLRWGSPDTSSRDHVLVLDTSSWMAARVAQGTLLDQARTGALAWLRSLPSGDRVLVLYADALATPATAFADDRKAAREAVIRAHAGPSALRLRDAVEAAQRILKLHARRPGEIVLAGASRISDDPEGWAPPANLRLLAVRGDPDNVGLRRLALRRSPVEPDLWQIFVSVRNYGSQPRTIDLGLQFGGAPAGARRLRLAPGAEQEGAFEYRTRAAGWMEARIRPGDAFTADDRAVVEVPERKPVTVAVCSAEPELLRPLLAANPLIEATFLPPARCAEAGAAAIVILDRVAPQPLPQGHLVWIEPPSDRSPARVRARAADARIERWRTGHALGAGLRAQDLRLESAMVFEAAAGDVAIAETAQGAVILARPATSSRPARQVIFGFHPMRTALRYELTTPLLFANVMRWAMAESFRRYELQAAGVGAITVPVEPDLDTASVRVQAEDGRELPFTVQEGQLRFYAGAPGRVQVTAGDRAYAYSLTLPEVAGTRWEPPDGIRKGARAASTGVASASDLWQALAVLGGLLLLIEWFLFGRARDGVRRVPALPRLLRLDLRGRFRRMQRPVRRAS